MIKVDVNNPFLLKCAEGERITVRVESSNTVHSVVYSLDGNAVLPVGQVLTFRATKNLVRLTLALNFSNSSSSYEVAVSGDQGGDVSTVVEPARGGLASFLAFTFLAGDPTIFPP